MIELSTRRLLLRRWQESDREPFARMNGDARLAEFLPATPSRERSDQFIERIETHFREWGFGLYAAEFAADQSFIGYIGLAVPKFTAPFTPCVEIGWRLCQEHWGQGLATEGAREVVRFAFTTLRLDSLVSFTVPANTRSRRVMEKIGMTNDPAEEFDHPNLPQGHPQRHHVLYRLRKLDWQAATDSP
jgi:RimJ/RimL family protein N-acetyltransferase